MHLTATLEHAQRLGALKTIKCTCGGGFAPIRISVDSLADDWIELGSVYPADSNMAQELPLSAPDLASETSVVRLRLCGSTDAFGRVIIYELGLFT